MKLIQTDLPEVVIVEPTVFTDERGWFMESFNEARFHQELKKLGLPPSPRFVQDNHSLSKKGVLRGLHYQLPPYMQGKLVRVVEGAAYDVVVDIREGSSTFGQFIGLELSKQNNKMLWIPPGFAHGFVALEEDTHFLYKTTDFYHKESEACLHWNDPSIGINWPLSSELILNEKDNSAPFIEEIVKLPFSRHSEPARHSESVRHPERSEGSPYAQEIPRCARDDGVAQDDGVARDDGVAQDDVLTQDDGLVRNNAEPSLVALNIIGDERGSLIVIEQNSNIDFPLKRAYYIFDTKTEISRGFHAHKSLQQLAVCVAGKCRILLDDGKTRKDYWLDSPSKGLIINHMTWREMHDFSEDCVLIVFANENYSEADYIRNYHEFIEMSQNA